MSLFFLYVSGTCLSWNMLILSIRVQPNHALWKKEDSERIDVTPHIFSCRSSKKLKTASFYRILAAAWFSRYHHTPFSFVCIQRSIYLRRRTKGWGWETHYSRWRDEAFILKCTGINKSRGHGSLFSAPCSCSHASTAALSPHNPSYFLHHRGQLKLSCCLTYFLRYPSALGLKTVQK